MPGLISIFYQHLTRTTHSFEANRAVAFPCFKDWRQMRISHPAPASRSLYQTAFQPSCVVAGRFIDRSYANERARVVQPNQASV